MVQPVLHLLDPSGRLRASSPSLRAGGSTEHGRAAALLEAMRPGEAPAIAVADVAGLAQEDAALLASAPDRAWGLLLVAVDDEAAGRRWLESAAADFVVFPARAGELEGRLRRLLELAGRLACWDASRPTRGDFLRELTHEIKNPLNAIFGYCELLLLEPGFGDEARSDLERIVENANCLLQICDRLGRQAGEDLERLRLEERAP
jgi:signal transduction histidine kinase